MKYKDAILTIIKEIEVETDDAKTVSRDIDDGQKTIATQEAAKVQFKRALRKIIGYGKAIEALYDEA